MMCPGNTSMQLGRAPPADILIEIPTVSTRHATLRVGEASVIVTDLGSTNGTTIDGEELEATQAVRCNQWGHAQNLCLS